MMIYLNMKKSGYYKLLPLTYPPLLARVSQRVPLFYPPTAL